MFGGAFSQIAAFFRDIPLSRDYRSDFRAWSQDRLVSRYTILEPWCRLLLDESVAPVTGEHRVPALIFPMERLFEAYIGSVIKENLPTGYKLIPQSKKHYLAFRGDAPFFLMKPDYVVRMGIHDILIVDAKWKNLEASDADGESVDASQTDLYQLYAYGCHYLSGKGQMALAYPMTDSFQKAATPFSYASDPNLQLSLIPVDLERDPRELIVFIESALKTKVTANMLGDQ
jgi:5-methylcytosine-specific restriction enzyme subunit McrC